MASIALGETVTLVLEAIDATAPSHIRLDWTPDRSAGQIGQENGWYDPATGIWVVDYRADRAVARVVRYASRPAARSPAQPVFEGYDRDIGVVIDGRPANAAVTGTHALVTLPGRDGVLRVHIGTRDGGGLMTVFLVVTAVQGERVQLSGGK